MSEYSGHTADPDRPSLWCVPSGVALIARSGPVLFYELSTGGLASSRTGCELRGIWGNLFIAGDRDGGIVVGHVSICPNPLF